MGMPAFKFMGGQIVGGVIMAGRSNGEEKARWIVPQPAYMREAEPHEHGFADVGPPASRVDPLEQRRNRELFMAREKRKVPRPDHAGSEQQTNERKTG